jgi:hypothetical protein
MKSPAWQSAGLSRTDGTGGLGGDAEGPVHADNFERRP